MMTSKITLAPMKLTEEQSEWVEGESARTGNPKTTIVRSLIQQQIDDVKKGGKK